MKILILATHINIGGIGIYTFNLAKYLKKRGVDVVVASSGGGLERFFVDEKIPHETLDIKTKSEFGIKIWKALPRLVSFVKKNNFDVIHAQTRVAQVMACIASGFTGVPVVSTCHGFYKHTRLGRKIFPCWGNKVIAISSEVKEHLINDFGLKNENIFQIYNGIEVDKFKNAAPGFNEKNIVIGTVGRFSPVKGHRYLLEAFRDVVRQYPDSRLLFIGDDGGEKEKLQKNASDWRISEHVKFESPKRENLEEYLSMIDIFCLPSLAEGLGLSLMEAMASGCACVASRVGGVSELIDDEKDGLLVESADSKTLGRALAKLIGNENLRRSLGEKAREKAAREFDIEDSVDKTIKVYEACINI